MAEQMQITLLINDTMQHMLLPSKIKGKYAFFHHNEYGKYEEFISVEATGGKWYAKAGKKTYLFGENKEKVLETPIEASKVNLIGYRRSDQRALIYPQLITEDRKLFNHYTLPRQGKILIGRNESFRGADINYNLAYISTKHAELSVFEDNIEIKDLGSVNGTFVNGKKVTEAVLKPGDLIELFGLRMIVGKGYISLNNPDGAVSVNQSILVPMSMIQLEKTNGEANIWAEEDQEEDYFYRSPRYRRGFEDYEFKIDPPPAYHEFEKTPMILILGPSLTMGMTSVVVGLISVQNALNNGGNMMSSVPTLIMSFSMLIGTILWPVMSKRYETKKHTDKENLRQNKYLAYLEKRKSELESLIEDHKAHLFENYVDVKTCMSRVQSSENNIWERMAKHEDFLELRLGKGNLVAPIHIKAPERSFSLHDDNLQEEIFKITEHPLWVTDSPIRTNLRSHWITGVVGEKKRVAEFVKGLLLQASALHSYDELKICLLFNPMEIDIFKEFRWLPHAWSDDQSLRFFASEPNEIKEVFNQIEKVYFNRLEIDREDELEKVEPHYLIVTLDKEITEKSALYQKILKDDKYRGISFINAFEAVSELPKESSVVIELSEEEGKVYDYSNTNAQIVSFKPDSFDANAVEPYFKALANIRLRKEESNGDLPNMLTFLEMFGSQKVEHLNILSRWKENSPVRSLEAPIGVLPSGELFKLDLHEKYHGPHGLIAGMTGSGKSEFIMTFILSLAVNYHPHEVAFILIDYKGGGMADAFAHLPHLAGTITNLDGSSVRRSLISIQSELKRRQRIFSETGKRLNTSNIDIYKYQSLFREGKVTEPVQHLFIISDEFAELKAQQPEFMAQLISAARIGRSLGVHLILATQKPAGVVDDQIWSNSKFRICLKVQERADSMDVIKRPDAAELKNTGRYYVQVGFNELFELGQSAWAGAAYNPDQELSGEVEKELSVIDAVGRVLTTVKVESNNKGKQSSIKQIDVINQYLTQIAEEEQIKVKQLWMPPLKDGYSVKDLMNKYGVKEGSSLDLCPIIGEFDDPENQAQKLMRVPFSTEGNLILYSSQGSGEDMFVNSLIQSLTSQYTSSEVNLYVMDFASESLKAYEKLPHVGEVLFLNEEEKIKGLLSYLAEELTVRKAKIAEYEGNLMAFKAESGEAMPYLMTIIHNYSAFTEGFEDIETQLMYLAREGKKYGILFVLTALNTNAVRYRMQQNFKLMYALQLNDPGEYGTILGNTEGTFPSKVMGRGIFRDEKVFEFQTCASENVRDFVQNRPVTKGKKAKRIAVMPEILDPETLYNLFLEENSPEENPWLIPVGIEKESLKLTCFDLKQNVINGIHSNTGIHLPVAITAVEHVFRNGIASVYILNGQENQAFGIEKVKEAILENDLESVVVELFNLVVKRHNESKEALLANLEQPTFEPVVIVLNGFKRIKGKLSEDARDKLSLVLDKNQKAFNVGVLMVDTKDGIYEYYLEDWYKAHSNAGTGIWIGSGVAEQSYINLKVQNNALYKPVEDDQGYVLEKGKPRLLKFASREVEADE